MSNFSNNIILPSYAAVPAKNLATYDPVIGPQKLSQLPPIPPNNLSNPNNNNTNLENSSTTIYDKNLNRRVPEVNLSSLSFLFQEMVSWTHQSSQGIQQLENKLNILGYSIGSKILELSYLRENQSNSNLKKTLKKDVKIIEILQFIHSTIWKNLFGKTADELEKSSEVDNEYMIIDNDPIISQFISIPKDLNQLNCCAFVAGIIEGLLDCAYFQANVTAHNVPKENFPRRTVYLIRFDKSVIEREMIRFG